MHFPSQPPKDGNTVCILIFPGGDGVALKANSPGEECMAGRGKMVFHFDQCFQYIQTPLLTGHRSACFSALRLALELKDLLFSFAHLMGHTWSWKIAFHLSACCSAIPNLCGTLPVFMGEMPMSLETSRSQARGGPAVRDSLRG